MFTRIGQSKALFNWKNESILAKVFQNEPVIHRGRPDWSSVLEVRGRWGRWTSSWMFPGYTPPPPWHATIYFIKMRCVSRRCWVICSKRVHLYKSLETFPFFSSFLLSFSSSLFSLLLDVGKCFLRFSPMHHCSHTITHRFFPLLSLKRKKIHL